MKVVNHSGHPVLSWSVHHRFELSSRCFHSCLHDRELSSVMRAFKEPPSPNPEDLDVLQIQVRQVGNLRFETQMADGLAASMAPHMQLL